VNVVEAEVAAIENVGTAEWRLPDFQSLVRSVDDRVDDLAGNFEAPPAVENLDLGG